jgi:hypothetical protein
MVVCSSCFQKKKPKKKPRSALRPAQTKTNSSVLCPGFSYGVGSTVVMIGWWFGPFGAAVRIFMVLRRNNLHQTLQRKYLTKRKLSNTRPPDSPQHALSASSRYALDLSELLQLRPADA